MRTVQNVTLAFAVALALAVASPANTPAPRAPIDPPKPDADPAATIPAAPTDKGTSTPEAQPASGAKTPHVPPLSRELAAKVIADHFPSTRTQAHMLSALTAAKLITPEPPPVSKSVRGGAAQGALVQAGADPKSTPIPAKPEPAPKAAPTPSPAADGAKPIDSASAVTSPEPAKPADAKAGPDGTVVRPSRKERQAAAGQPTRATPASKPADAKASTPAPSKPAEPTAAKPEAPASATPPAPSDAPSTAPAVDPTPRASEGNPA